MAAGISNAVRSARPLSVAVLLLGCAHGELPRPSADYGLNRAAAVEVCLPPGQTAFLKGLRCPGGDAPRAERLGGVGPRNEVGPDDGERALLQMDPGRPLQRGERDLHVIDAFKLSCGARETTIYFDMYHCGAPAPRAAPLGFSFEAPDDD
jgi:hypothetical protein